MQSVPGFSVFDIRRVSPEKSPVCKVVNSFLQKHLTANSIRTFGKRGRTKFNVYLVISVVTIHVYTLKAKIYFLTKGQEQHSKYYANGTRANFCDNVSAASAVGSRRAVAHDRTDVVNAEDPLHVRDLQIYCVRTCIHTRLLHKASCIPCEK